jgi:transposase
MSADLARGLAAGARFRCDGCGNVTRFDVVATTRTRRYHHFDLGGQGHVEEEEVLEQTVESVTCRWCGRTDAVQVESAPAGT